MLREIQSAKLPDIFHETWTS